MVLYKYNKTDLHSDGPRSELVQENLIYTRNFYEHLRNRKTQTYREVF